MSNLFANLPTDLPQELVEPIVYSPHVRIERIVSTGQATPPGSWYDQDEAEWVVVLQGEARLRFEGADEAIHLKAGDHVDIPAHQKHRVEWTTDAGPTVWVGVFYRSG